MRRSGPSEADIERWRSAFGNRLRELREVKGLSQLELATRSSVSQPYLSDLEQGRGNPTLVKLHVLARELEVDVRELLATPDRSLRTAKHPRSRR